MKDQRGFSLIELMVAVAIVGILAAVAFPSYNKSMVKSRRAAAEAFLMQVALSEQQYLTDARTYASATFTKAAPSPAALPGVSLPSEVAPYYTVAATAVNTAGQPPTFTVTATPIAGTKQASDGTLSIDQTGAKTSSQKPGQWP